MRKKIKSCFLFFISLEDRKVQAIQAQLRRKIVQLSDQFHGVVDYLWCSSRAQAEPPGQPGVGHFIEKKPLKRWRLMRAPSSSAVLIPF